MSRAPGRRPRLLLLITCLEGGGAQRTVHDLATRIPRDRWEIKVMALRRPSQGQVRWEAPLREAGIEVACAGLAPPLYLPGLIRLLHEARAFKPDLIHAQLFHAHLAGRLLARLTGTAPAVICTHQEVERRCRPLRPLLERWTGGRDGAVVAVSQAVARHALARLGAPPARLRTIPNGLDLDHFHPRSRDRALLDLPQEAEVIGAVGRLHPQKGLEHLLEAFAELARRRPSALLALVGEGPEEPRLRARAAALGLEDRVRFSGYRADIPEVLACFDVLAMPSLWEGFGLVLAEALACGVPTVCTDVDSLPEVAGPAARLVPPARPDLLAQALEELLDRPALRRELGRAGPIQARRWSVEQTVSAHLALYEELLGGAR